MSACSSAKEILVKLIQIRGASNEEAMQQAFGLTLREAEVLYWLTLAKTNRDISKILSLGARTVNKRFEQVSQKMGVDNRTSAAVLADRKIMETIRNLPLSHLPHGLLARIGELRGAGAHTHVPFTQENRWSNL